MSRRTPKIVAGGLALLLLLLLSGPWLVRILWARRASNPVRRGVSRARELGCFSCHGDLGRQGTKDPGAKDLEVPAWSGGMYMMYVKNDDDIRRFILNGSTPKVEGRQGFSGAPPEAAISMPSFKDSLEGSDLEDLVAAYKVASGMSRPPADGAEERGFQAARSWGCFSCHGPGGSGGLPNPGSFTGFIPGWYGADFRDLVRGKEEFVTWIREGEIPRLTGNPLAALFLRRQRIRMPRYRGLESQTVQDLWTYALWLERTGGGLQAH
jgi:hypothetical protein